MERDKEFTFARVIQERKPAPPKEQSRQAQKRASE
jgi:hypothetical protein